MRSKCNLKTLIALTAKRLDRKTRKILKQDKDELRSF